MPINGFVVGVVGVFAAVTLVALGIPSEARAQIVGGRPIDIRDAPWQVELVIESDGRREICGGSLIAPRWVLTAAHCFVGTNGIDRTQARFGVTDIRSVGPMVVRDRVITHPAYDKSALANDIAIVHLTAQAPGTVIALLHDDRVLKSAVALEVTGWGATQEGGGIASSLMSARVPLVSNTVCNATASYSGQVKPSMLCAGFVQGGIDACQGDSGGPLVLRQSGKPPLLVGIVSFGIGCARPQKYSV